MCLGLFYGLELLCVKEKTEISVVKLTSNGFLTLLMAVRCDAMRCALSFTS